MLSKNNKIVYLFKILSSSSPLFNTVEEDHRFLKFQKYMPGKNQSPPYNITGGPLLLHG